MTTYRVTWTIDAEGESAQEAAQEALKAMQDLSYPTTHFEVTDSSGATEQVQVLTDNPVIYDSWTGDEDCTPGFADRYTVFLQPNHPDPEIRRCFLGCSEGGRAFSQWGEVKDDDWSHLGCRLSLADLDKETRDHIIFRAKGAS